MKENSTRVAIIDSSNGTLYIEDVSEEDIKEYGGDIDTYIEANYNTTNCTWQVVTAVCYVPDATVYDDPISLDKLIDECYE